MKNKAPLALMEQSVMVLVFALAAVLCLQVFVVSHRMSCYGEAQGRAVTAAQNAAESLKLSRGDFAMLGQLIGGTGDEAQWTVSYDGDWNEVTQESAEYMICITPIQTQTSLLGSAQVRAETSEGDSLFEVTVSWQEEAHE